MNILIFGSGTIGTLYGWAFREGGHQVTHYIRPGGTNAFEAGPVSIAITDRRPRLYHSRHRSYQPPVTYSFYPSDHYDLILVSVPHRRVADTLEVLRERAGDAPILFFGNQWDGFDRIERELAGRYLFGFPHNGGAIDRQTLEGTLTRQISLAEPDGRVTPRLRDIQTLFEQCGFSPRLQPDFRGWCRVHFAWNAATMSVALREGGMVNYARNFRAIRHSFAVMRETMEVVRAMGTAPEAFGEGRMAYGNLFFRALLTRLMFLFIMPVMKTAEKHARHAAPELKSYYDDLWKTARRLGVPTPLFDALKPAIDALPEVSGEAVTEGRLRAVQS